MIDDFDTASMTVRATERFAYIVVDSRAIMHSNDGQPRLMSFREAYRRGYCLSLHKLLPTITWRKPLKKDS